MPEKKRQKDRAKTLRTFRKVHRTTGALLFVFFFVISITAALLGWKKNSGDLLLPKVRTGTVAPMSEWLSMEALTAKAILEMQDAKTSLDRIDIRPDKGVAKFLFLNKEEVQIDVATGQLLYRGNRLSDTIENIHDGSILDRIFNTRGILKLVYTSIMSLALLLFTVTGFWLWHGPKRMRKANRK